MGYELTEEDVRGLYHVGAFEMGDDDEEAGREFDEWLAEVKRAASEKAYERALDDLNGEGFLNADEHEMFAAWHNPYRKETQ